MDLQRDLDAGVLLDEPGKHARCEIFAGSDDGQLQATGLEAANVGERVFEIRQRMEDLLAGSIKVAPGFGEMDALADLFEQGQTDGFGKLLDLHRHRRLCQEEFFGGTGETPEPCDEIGRASCRERV